MKEDAPPRPRLEERPDGTRYVHVTALGVARA
jgi:hypothetical protein